MLVLRTFALILDLAEGQSHAACDQCTLFGTLTRHQVEPARMRCNATQRVLITFSLQLILRPASMCNPPSQSGTRRIRSQHGEMIRLAQETCAPGKYRFVSEASDLHQQTHQQSLSYRSAGLGQHGACARIRYGGFACRMSLSLLLLAKVLVSDSSARDAGVGRASARH